jgi:hypothetical protein
MFRELIFRGLIGLRDATSDIFSRFRQETSWEPQAPGSIEDLEYFLQQAYRWKRDAAYGLLDNMQTIRHMNWQLETTNRIEGDCDDFAKYTSYLLHRMGYRDIHIANILTMRHVIVIYGTGEAYNIFSNHIHYPIRAQDLDDAIQEYAAANGKRTNRHGYLVESASRYLRREGLLEDSLRGENT